jgi:hypothetical protein
MNDALFMHFLNTLDLFNYSNQQLL